jgi:hypothetical protein
MVKESAGALSLSMKTNSTYRMRILSKLHLCTRPRTSAGMCSPSNCFASLPVVRHLRTGDIMPPGGELTLCGRQG